MDENTKLILKNAKKVEKEHLPTKQELKKEDSQFMKLAKKAARLLTALKKMEPMPVKAARKKKGKKSFGKKARKKK